MDRTVRNINIAALLAAIAGMGAGLPGASAFRMPTPKRVRKYPTMVISSPEEIAAWNAAVDARKEARFQRRAAAWMAGETA